MTTVDISRVYFDQRAWAAVPDVSVQARADRVAYYRSEQWWERRRLILALDGYRCQHCGQGRADGVRLHVHHLNYDRLGCEWPEDLRTLCADCHAAEHGHAR